MHTQLESTFDNAHTLESTPDKHLTYIPPTARPRSKKQWHGSRESDNGCKRDLYVYINISIYIYIYIYICCLLHDGQDLLHAAFLFPGSFLDSFGALDKISLEASQMRQHRCDLGSF